MYLVFEQLVEETYLGIYQWLFNSDKKFCEELIAYFPFI
jgi:hypothetical protein